MICGVVSSTRNVSTELRSEHTKLILIRVYILFLCMYRASCI